MLFCNDFSVELSKFEANIGREWENNLFTGYWDAQGYRKKPPSKNLHFPKLIQMGSYKLNKMKVRLFRFLKRF